VTESELKYTLISIVNNFVLPKRMEEQMKRNVVKESNFDKFKIPSTYKSERKAAENRKRNCRNNLQ
jgi:hypothetical protein